MSHLRYTDQCVTREARMARVHIIGVGNEIAGDDAVGPAVITALRQRDLTGDVELISVGADALGVIEYLQDDCDAIIVDAAHMGQVPGSVLIFPASRAKMTIVSDAFSLHGIGLSYALKIAEQLGLAARVTIVGIEPESIEPGHGMTAAVAAAVPAAVEAVTKLLNSKCRAACSPGGAASAPA
ncbi:MAG TPA: hydrogenase maturation protease [Planctomycetota bacterium]|nr:hydrogenase maturation protease [Planctomycetota bacterium]